jgi:hypothetical protein
VVFNVVEISVEVLVVFKVVLGMLKILRIKFELWLDKKINVMANATTNNSGSSVANLPNFI